MREEWERGGGCRGGVGGKSREEGGRGEGGGEEEGEGRSGGRV